MSNLSQNSRKHGTVKFFNKDKGFGFIEIPEEKDVFIHANECNGETFTQYDEVTFETKETPKGIQAVNVQSA